MRQGLADRGADISWLSQYPHEEEITFPPATGLQVTERAVDKMFPGVLVVQVMPAVLRWPGETQKLMGAPVPPVMVDGATETERKKNWLVAMMGCSPAAAANDVEHPSSVGEPFVDEAMAVRV